MDGYPQVTSATNGWMPTLHYAHVATFHVAVAASPVLVMCDGKPYELALIRTSCPEGSLHSYAIKCMLVQRTNSPSSHVEAVIALRLSSR